MKLSHPLIETYKNVKGNQRVSLYTEMLWSIPNKLYDPFLSMYMVALGLHDKQVGMIASINLAVQLFWSLFSGAITDKIGRKRTMVVFDTLAWSVSCFIWAISQNYIYFLIATLFNGMWRVTGNSFNCVLIEGEDTKNLINIFTILNLQALVAGFVAPLAGYFIDKYTMIPTMRIILFVSFISMSLKFYLFNKWAVESDIGRMRMEESKGVSIFKMTFNGFGDFIKALKGKQLLLGIIFASLLTVVVDLNKVFWPLFLNTLYSINESTFSNLLFTKTFFSLLVFIFVMPYIRTNALKIPLLATIVIQIIGVASLLLGLLLPSTPFFPVIISAVCEGIAVASVVPIKDTIMSHSVPVEKRASFNSFIYASSLVLGIPMGWLTGLLSEKSRVYPMILILSLLVAMFVVASLLVKVFKEQKASEVS